MGMVKLSTKGKNLANDTQTVDFKVDEYRHRSTC